MLWPRLLTCRPLPDWSTPRPSQDALGPAGHDRIAMFRGIPWTTGQGSEYQKDHQTGPRGGRQRGICVHPWLDCGQY